jgi:PPE-repeat protein
MFLDFSWLPPEVNSERIFAGAGSGSLHLAATAWHGLAQDLQAAASSFESVVTALASGPWSGPASAAMVAAAMPYVGWLGAAAGQAAASAAQAVVAATAFEVAQAATVHPLSVAGNRTTLQALLKSNIFGFNLPAIAATEFEYVEMWAQDVGAMLGYHAGATSVATSLASTSATADVSSWAGQLGTALVGAASQAGTQLASQGAGLSSMLSTGIAAIPGVVTGVEAAASALPLSSVSQLGQIAMYPASMMMSPMMSLLQMAQSGSGGMGAAANAAALGAGAAADMPKLAGDAMPAAMKGIGGAGGLGAGMAGELGKARLVGAMSVPPTWEGSMPKGMTSAAMAGLGPGLPAAEMAAAAAGAAGSPAGGGMPMMPMPMGMGGGGGMPGGMMGRGGASPHVLQNRPSVVPRTGVG